MAKLLGVCLLGMLSLSAIEIPREDQLKTFSLKKGIEVWLKDHFTSPSQIACRFVGQDRIQGKPQIFDLDCPADIFEEELPTFLDYCEEEIQKKGGAPIGIVAVGSVDSEGVYHYLSNRYNQSENKNTFSEAAIQLIPDGRPGEFDVLLTYPTFILSIQSETDLKKLWVFYLIQSMAEKRFKKTTVDAEGEWISKEDIKYLLPAQKTAGHGIEKIQEGLEAQSRLLQSFLIAIRDLKEKGFTHSELADAKAQLIKHLKRFYDPNPSEKTYADFYASHLAASLAFSQYEPFMAASFLAIPEINMADIAEMLKVSFDDDTRQVVIHHPEGSAISEEKIQTVLNKFISNDVEVKVGGSEEVIIVEGNDPFSQLIITDEEQKLLRGVIHIVATTHPVILGTTRYSEVKEKEEQLLHIHPLRSLATMLTDSHTTECLAKIRGSVKWGYFLSDFAKRINHEHKNDNVLKYVHGFCMAVKANPDQVRLYITNKKWEALVDYLIKLKNN